MKEVVSGYQLGSSGSDGSLDPSRMFIPIVGDDEGPAAGDTVGLGVKGGPNGG